jgi:hypothetical protein
MNLIKRASKAKHYVHSTSFGIETWELLADHCENALSLAPMLADEFIASTLGRAHDNWQDLGLVDANESFRATASYQMIVSKRSQELFAILDESIARCIGLASSPKLKEGGEICHSINSSNC